MDQIRNILGGTGLSPASDQELRAAAVLAARSGAHLHVLHAVEPLAAMPVPAFGGAGAGMESLVVQHEWQNARATLDAQLGPHADGEGASPLLGTTAENVLRSAGVPVLVVRGTVPTPFARLLVATDPAEACGGIVDAALGWATAFCARAGDCLHARVDVVHVIPEVVSGKMPFNQATVEPAEHPEVQDAIARWPDVEVQARVLFGETVVDTLLEYARATTTDLLVAGSHGRGAIARAFLGSTSLRDGTPDALLRSAGAAVALDRPGRGRGRSRYRGTGLI